MRTSRNIAACAAFAASERKRVRAQAGLVILASNGLKIMAALQRRQTPAQAPLLRKNSPLKLDDLASDGTVPERQRRAV